MGSESWRHVPEFCIYKYSASLCHVSSLRLLPSVRASSRLRGHDRSSNTCFPKNARKKRPDAPRPTGSPPRSSCRTTRQQQRGRERVTVAGPRRADKRSAPSMVNDPPVPQDQFPTPLGEPTYGPSCYKSPGVSSAGHGPPRPRCHATRRDR